MRYFRRGAHHSRNAVLTVDELQAQIAVETIPTLRSVGSWPIVWRNGQEFYQLPSTWQWGPTS